jgi:hypothetical protein
MESGNAELLHDLMKRFTIWHAKGGGYDGEGAWRVKVVTASPPIKGSSDFRHPTPTDAVVKVESGTRGRAGSTRRHRRGKQDAIGHAHCRDVFSLLLARSEPMSRW